MALPGLFAVAVHEAEQVGEVDDGDYVESERFLDVLNGAGFRCFDSIASLLHSIESNENAGWNSAVVLDDVYGFTNRSSCRDDVVDDDYLALKLGANDYAALAVVLGFLAVEGPRNVASESGEVHCNAGCKRNSLVGRSEDHVEFNESLFLCFKKSASVELSEDVERSAGIEEAGVEEVRRHASGLRLVLSESEDIGLKGKLDEVVLKLIHFQEDDSNCLQGPAMQEEARKSAVRAYSLR